jgi:hypothetical protein
VADKDSPSPLGGNFTGILAVVMLVVGAVWVTQAPLEGSRPPTPETVYQPPGSVQDADARMWEDPFDAVERYRKRNDTQQRGSEERKQRQSLVDAVQCLSTPSNDQCRKGTDEAASEAYRRHGDRLDEESALRNRLAGGKATLLVATVTGAPYGMAGEFRRKQRYAILSGLHLAGFEPFDPEHVGFLEFDVARGDRTLPPILPYEIFERRGSAGATETLLVAWYNEDYLWTGPPIRHLHKLFERIAYDDKKRKPPGLTIDVIGPGSSGILKQMVRELQQDAMLQASDGANEEEGLKRAIETSQVRFYASSPTASDASLVESSSDPSTCLKDEVEAVRSLQADGRLVEAEFRCRGVDLRRVTATDEKLAGALADELELRGGWQPATRIVGMELGEASDDRVIAALRQSPRVVLVSEWDTHYGREFPGIMRDALLADVKDEKKRDAWCPPQRLQGEHARSENCPIHYFTYMIGLDGQLPRAGEVREAAPSGERSDRQRDRARELERPVGAGQLDYLRRLSEQVVALDAELRSEGNRIGAVGVLGTDPYDKLLVMQALHPGLPEAVFFTTDLDALYLHPTEVKRGTANLVVASAFGLALHPRWQRSIMPFRDTYQTGAFLSTRLAVGASPPDPAQFIPRVYEIGRTALVDLSPLEKADCKGIACESIHPLRQLPRPRARAVGATIVAGVVLLVLFAFGFRQMQHSLALLGAVARARPVFSTALLVVLTVAAGLSLRELQDPAGEPWAIANGVSMWPTQMLRLATLAVTWMMLHKGWRDLVRSNQELGQEFMLAGTHRPHRSPTERSSLGRVAHWGRALGGVFRQRFRPWQTESDYDRFERRGIAEQWSDYLSPAGFGERLRLLVIPLALYVAFTLVLFYMLGIPAAPYRGAFMYWLDYIMVLTGILSFLVLLFFVIEETRRTCAFVRRLMRPSRWPPAALEKFGQRPGLADSDSVHRDLVAYIEDWVEIDLIGRRTAVVTELIYYPFVVITLLILARSPTFDNWTTPPVLVIVFGLSILIALGTAITLRRTVEKARGVAIDSLISKLQRAEQVGEARIAAEIRILIDRVRDSKVGAFCPFSQQPWVKALLIPLGSLSAVPILDFLAAASV